MPNRLKNKERFVVATASSGTELKAALYMRTCSIKQAELYLASQLYLATLIGTWRLSSAILACFDVNRLPSVLLSEVALLSKVQLLCLIEHVRMYRTAFSSVPLDAVATTNRSLFFNRFGIRLILHF